MMHRLTLPMGIVASMLGTGLCDLSAVASNRVPVALFGGDTTPTAPLAPWYRSIGITDVWLSDVEGAFPQDIAPQQLLSVNELQSQGTLASYTANQIKYSWLEKPVPDYFNATVGTSGHSIWSSHADIDTAWNEVFSNIQTIYPQVRSAGFSGLVYDTEGYYSGGALWQEEVQYGSGGNYYQRGLQFGQAINGVWPNAKVTMVYAFGYEGEKWFYKGIKDAGIDLHLGAEHTYGAGHGELGSEWYQQWWQGDRTAETVDWKRGLFPFVADNQHIDAGLFPINFGTNSPNYLATYFRQQLDSAANDDPNGPIPVWLWPSGPLTPESFQSVNYAGNDNAESYLSALRDYSEAFSGTPQPTSSVVYTSSSTGVAAYDESGAPLAGFTPILNGQNGLQTPQGIAVGANNVLYVVGQDSQNILRYNATTGAFIDEFANFGGVYYPEGVKLGQDVNSDTIPDLYVARYQTNDVVVIPTAGTGAGTPVLFATTDMQEPVGIEWGPDGKLYVASRGTSQIQRYNADGSFDTTFAGMTLTPGDMAFSANGLQFFTANTFPSGTTIDLYDAAGNLLTQSFVSGLTGGPKGMEFGPDGNLYVADTLGSSIVQIDPTTGAILDAAFVDLAGASPRYITWHEILDDLPASGDHNGDGTVDILDYITWRMSDGSPGGYSDWASQYGDLNGAGSSSVVPEPSTVSFALIATAAGMATTLVARRSRVAAR